MPNLPETGNQNAAVLPQIETATTAPAENTVSQQAGGAISLLYEYTSNSSAAEEWTLVLQFFNEQNLQINGKNVVFPPYPVLQYWSTGSAPEKLKYSETELKIKKTEYVPTEPTIKPILITFETHAVAPLKKGETLLVRVTG